MNECLNVGSLTPTPWKSLLPGGTGRPWFKHPVFTPPPPELVAPWTRQPRELGANQLALPKRLIRVPRPPAPACPCHTHVTRVLLTAWPGCTPREGPREEGRERRRGRADDLGPPYLSPLNWSKGKCREDFLANDPRTGEVTWWQEASPRLEWGPGRCLRAADWSGHSES